MRCWRAPSLHTTGNWSSGLERARALDEYYPRQSQDTRAVCRWGKMREKIGREKELVAPALANPVDPVLVSPPAVKCDVVSPTSQGYTPAAFDFRLKRRRLPVARFVAMENLKGYSAAQKMVCVFLSVSVSVWV